VHFSLSSERSRNDLARERWISRGTFPGERLNRWITPAIRCNSVIPRISGSPGPESVGTRPTRILRDRNETGRLPNSFGDSRIAPVIRSGRSQFEDKDCRRNEKRLGDFGISRRIYERITYSCARHELYPATIVAKTPACHTRQLSTVSVRATVMAEL